MKAAARSICCAEALRALLDKMDVPVYQAQSTEYLRSPEEALYHKLLIDGYSRPQVILPNVARWVANRHN